MRTEASWSACRISRSASRKPGWSSAFARLVNLGTVRGSTEGLPSSNLAQHDVEHLHLRRESRQCGSGERLHPCWALNAPYTVRWWDKYSARAEGPESSSPGQYLVVDKIGSHWWFSCRLQRRSRTMEWLRVTGRSSKGDSRPPGGMRRACRRFRRLCVTSKEQKDYERTIWRGMGNERWWPPAVNGIGIAGELGGRESAGRAPVAEQETGTGTGRSPLIHKWARLIGIGTREHHERLHRRGFLSVRAEFQHLGRRRKRTLPYSVGKV